jgi:hypothetical protein
LIVMGPNVRKFGEDEEVDKLIRKYGIVRARAWLTWWC